MNDGPTIGWFRRRANAGRQFCINRRLHSKTTMAAADVLHGVTQRESGVSIRVSVKLDDIADDGAIRPNAVADSDTRAA